MEKDKVEFYVDFETVNDLNDNFKKLPYTNFGTCIFMIGCIANYYDKDLEEYKSEFRALKNWLSILTDIYSAFERFGTVNRVSYVPRKEHILASSSVGMSIMVFLGVRKKSIF